jgi:hypothetical protein
MELDVPTFMAWAGNNNVAWATSVSFEDEGMPGNRYIFDFGSPEDAVAFKMKFVI